MSLYRLCVFFLRIHCFVKHIREYVPPGFAFLRRTNQHAHLIVIPHIFTSSLFPLDFNPPRLPLQLLQTSAVRQHYPQQSPHLLGGVLQRPRRLALEQVHVGQEVVRTPTALQTRNELHVDAVDAIGEAIVLPFHFAWMLFAFVEQEGLHVIGGDWIAGQVKVAVAERLQDAETAATTGAWGWGCDEH